MEVTMLPAQDTPLRRKEEECDGVTAPFSGQLLAPAAPWKQGEGWDGLTRNSIITSAPLLLLLFSLLPSLSHQALRTYAIINGPSIVCKR